MSKDDPKLHTPGPATETHAHDDAPIVAPRGTKRGRFLLALLLAFIVLTTFTVSQEVVACFSGETTRASKYMTFRMPNGDSISLDGGEFMHVKQNYDRVLGILRVRGKDITDDDTAQFVVLDAVAKDAGISVTDAELSNFILPRFGAAQAYHDVMREYRTTPHEFEETLRALLRVERYKALVAAPLASVDPAEVERLWKSGHQEHAFDYVELPAANLADEAKALAPTGDELKKWFDGLSEPEKNKYKTQESAKAETAFITLTAETKGTELLEKYPQPAITDEQARAYYDGFRHARFRDPNWRLDPQKGFQPEDMYFKFDDVKEQCRTEKAIYDALLAWITDLKLRKEKNEPFDLQAEAQAMHLGARNQPDPMPRSAWAQPGIPGWGLYVADAVMSPETTLGDFYAVPVVTDNAFTVLRVLERNPSRTPEFPEIEAKVSEDWVRKKSTDLAVAKLESLRDKLGTRPSETDPGAALWRPEADAAKFAQVATEAGFTVQHRDFAERLAPQKPGDTPTPAQLFLQQAGPLWSVPENQVAKAEPSRDGQFAFLVRSAGARDPDVGRMKPNDWQLLSQQAVNEARGDFQKRVFGSIDWFKTQYSLHVKSWDDKKPVDS